jgi:hypothetical protein
MAYMSHTPGWLVMQGRWGAGDPRRLHRLLVAQHLAAVLADDRRAVSQPPAWILGIVFVRFCVPETKGRAVEDIDEYWPEGREWPEHASDSTEVAAASCG